MKPFTRREFLHLSMTATVGLLAAACAPVPSLTPVYTATTPPLDSETLAKVEKLSQATLSLNPVPGLAVGVVKDGKVAYAKGFGVAKIGTDKPVTTQSLFQLMDLTYLFTSVAAMQLVEQGKLDLDVPIVEYLPYFQLKDERHKQITTRHLLSESAGLPITPEYNPSVDWIGKTPQYDAGALERYVRSLSDVRIYTDPGTSRAFSNMSYDIAGDVIAKVSGEIFEDYMQQHILTPLAMTESTFYAQKANRDLLVSPHITKGTTVLVSDLVTTSRERTPSVGLFSNIDDLSRWVMASLNRGELDGKRILQSSSYDQLWRPTVHLDYAEDMMDEGLGWFLGSDRGHSVCQYWGNNVGFHAGCYLAPEEKVGVIVLGNQFTSTNATSFYAQTLASLVLEAVAFQ